MRAELRSFHSPDVDDLESYQPVDPERFGVLVQMFVGPTGEQGEESFDLVVCTPTWLRDEVRQDGPTLGLHYLFVEVWNWDEVERFCRRQVDQLDEPTWRALAVQLNKVARWEFDDYE